MAVALLSEEKVCHWLSLYIFDISTRAGTGRVIWCSPGRTRSGESASGSGVLHGMPILVDHPFQGRLGILCKGVFIARKSPVQSLGILIAELAMAPARVSIELGVNM